MSYDGRVGRSTGGTGVNGRAVGADPPRRLPGALCGSMRGEPSLGVEPSPHPYQRCAQPLSYKGVGLAGTTRTCYLRLRRAALCPDELRRDGVDARGRTWNTRLRRPVLCPLSYVDKDAARKRGGSNARRPLGLPGFKPGPGPPGCGPDQVRTGGLRLDGATGTPLPYGAVRPPPHRWGPTGAPLAGARYASRGSNPDDQGKSLAR